MHINRARPPHHVHAVDAAGGARAKRNLPVMDMAVEEYVMGTAHLFEEKPSAAQQAEDGRWVGRRWVAGGAEAPALAVRPLEEQAAALAAAQRGAAPPQQPPVAAAGGGAGGGGAAGVVELPGPELVEPREAAPWLERPAGVAGRLFFIGWLDPERRFELYRDEGGREYVRPAGGSGWVERGEFERRWRLLMESLGGSNVVVVSEPMGVRVVLVRGEGGGWLRLAYDPGTNSYRLEPADARWLADRLLHTAAGAWAGSVRFHRVEDVLRLVREEADALLFGGVEEALRRARLKDLFPELRGHRWVPMALVWDALVRRLGREGVRVSFGDDRQLYKEFYDLVMDITLNPHKYSWKEIKERVGQMMARSAQRAATG